MQIDMKLLEIERTSDPKIIGVSDAGSQIETFYTKDRQSLPFEERQHLENSCRDFFKNKKGIYYHDFEELNLKEITLYKSKKRVKETDVLGVLIQNSFGLLGYAFSKEAVSILENYHLPPYEKISLNIPEFINQYYLMRFSGIPMSNIDYSKSIFLNHLMGNISFNNYDDYKQSNASLHETYLDFPYTYDVALLGRHLFISENILRDFREKNLIGYETTNRVIFKI